MKKWLTKQIKIPGGWWTALDVLCAISVAFMLAGYGETVLIVWGTAIAVLIVSFVAYLLSGFATLS